MLSALTLLTAASLGANSSDLEGAQKARQALEALIQTLFSCRLRQSSDPTLRGQPANLPLQFLPSLTDKDDTTPLESPMNPPAEGFDSLCAPLVEDVTREMESRRRGTAKDMPSCVGGTLSTFTPRTAFSLRLVLRTLRGRTKGDALKAVIQALYFDGDLFTRDLEVNRLLESLRA